MFDLDAFEMAETRLRSLADAPDPPRPQGRDRAVPVQERDAPARLCPHLTRETAA